MREAFDAYDGVLYLGEFKTRELAEEAIRVSCQSRGIKGKTIEQRVARGVDAVKVPEDVAS